MTTELLKLLIYKGVPYNKIGKMENISGAVVRKHAKKQGIILPKRREINPCETFNRGLHHKNKMRVCPICGKSFVSTHTSHTYCGVSCGRKAGKIGRRKKIREWDGIERVNMWKITSIYRNHDYMYAYIPEHPFASSTGCVYLHRVLVENKIGRLLTKDEVVHHKDRNTLNNDIDNLQLMTKQEHTKLHANLRKKNKAG